MRNCFEKFKILMKRHDEKYGHEFVRHHNLQENLSALVELAGELAPLVELAVELAPLVELAVELAIFVELAVELAPLALQM
jgi:GAF domain-containing protein